MPFRAPSVCGCGRVVPTGQRCPCKPYSGHTIDGRRLTAHQRGYTARWRIERATFLIANPKCLFCPKHATVVDHQYPHRGDMTIFWDRTKWQPLCQICHSSVKQKLECSAP